MIRVPAEERWAQTTVSLPVPAAATRGFTASTLARESGWGVLQDVWAEAGTAHPAIIRLAAPTAQVFRCTTITSTTSALLFDELPVRGGIRGRADRR